VNPLKDPEEEPISTRIRLLWTWRQGSVSRRLQVGCCELRLSGFYSVVIFVLNLLTTAQTKYTI